MSRYVDSTITRQTGAVSRAGFGLALMVGTSKTVAYTEYAAGGAIAAITAEFGASSNEVKLATAILTQTPRPAKIAVVGVLFNESTDDETVITSALSTLRLAHDDWYYLACTSHTDGVIEALSAWNGTNNKLYFASTSNKTLGNTILRDNAIVLVHDKPELYPAEAWIGATAAFEPGTFTFTFKNLQGFPAAEYTSAEIDAIHAANGNTYIREGGVNITSNGKATSGEWIDIIQSQHYLDARIVENVFGLLVREPKVPFTAAGIAMTVAEVESAIKGAPEGMISRDESGALEYSITAPDITEVSTNDKASRLLPGIEWKVFLAGAIEKVEIRGTLAI